MTAPRDDLDVFYFFRDSSLRRAALRRAPGDAHRYVLFGLDQHIKRGVRARHNLDRPMSPPSWARVVDRGLNAAIVRGGGYGGDFAGVLPSLRHANRADVIFSTVDTVGIPLALLRRSGLVDRPIVYAAIGLPERLARLRPGRARRLYVEALGAMETIVAYSRYEVDVLRRELGRTRTRFAFVPFGVDIAHFRPNPAARLDVDVVGLGADPHRDFGLLLSLAARRPELRIRVVTTGAVRRALEPAPSNVELESDISFQSACDRLATARVVALPVRPNSYSGATTVLLQALALGKPVVISRTAAIADGYGLEDGGNCRLVEPGNPAAFDDAVIGLLRDEKAAAALGLGARRAAERLSWDRYADAMLELLHDTAALKPRRAAAR